MTDLQDFTAFLKTRKLASDAFVAGDAAPLQEISATQDPATIFGPKGDSIEGAAAVVSANNEGARHFAPGGQNDFQIMHMAASGDLAYWVGMQRSVVKMRGEESVTPMDLRVTEIFSP